MERKFKFIGDPKEYKWDVKPIKGQVYDFDRVKSNYGTKWFNHVFYTLLDFPNDWEEVHEPQDFGTIPDQKQLTKIPNQDMPASSMTKFEMAVIDIVSSFGSSGEYLDNDIMVNDAIELAKETFKQLNELK